MGSVIENGHLIDPLNKVDCITSIYIDDDKIAGIGKPPKNFSANNVIDATNKIVCPGLVDLSARLREPGSEYKATILSETRAAVSNGITILCCPPDTNPVIDSSAIVELINQRAESANLAKVYCLGALTHALGGETLANINTLKHAGCVGVSNAYMPITNTAILRRALEYAKTCNVTVHLFCEDSFLGNNGIIHEGPMSVRLGLAGIPDSAETIAISRVLLLLEQTGTRVHFCRLSSARSLKLVAAAKQQGLPVTADVGISHLFLSDVDTANFNSLCHLRPPLRSGFDRDELMSAVVNGTIDAICSDHQPHDEDAKAVPFGQTEAGASTVDVLLPLVLEKVRAGKIDMNQAISAITHQPSAILGVSAGHLGKGAPADVCIFDPDMSWQLNKQNIHSQGKNSPFLGWELQGRVTRTLVDGITVFEMEK